MSTDWGSMQKEYGGYSSYATPGVYKVKCSSVEFKELGNNGSIGAVFSFEEKDGLKFPNVTHWLSFKNDNWRKWHFRCLLVVLGSPAEKAEEAIDRIEAMESKERKIQGYQKAFDTLLSRGKSEVEIDVYPDGKYTRAEFTDRSVAMDNSASDKRDAAIDAEMDKVVTGSNADEEIDLSDLPF